MARRKDGRDTRDRVLRAARKVFAEKGLRDATVAEICTRARANLAAVMRH
jgi:AcrR family transcriptional regulator